MPLTVNNRDFHLKVPSGQAWEQALTTAALEKQLQKNGSFEAGVGYIHINTLPEN